MQNVSEHSSSPENTDGGERQQLKHDADNNSFSANNRKRSRKRKQEEVHEQGGDDGKEDTSSLKKPRVVWSVELHQKFVDALNHIGIHKAVPKNILERMNVPGLTRDNIASHLQKYRIYLRHQGRTNHSFRTAPDPTFGHVSALNGFDLQALAVAGQLRAQSLAQLQASGLGRPSSLTNPGMSVSPLVDQRSIFSFENPKTRFGHGHGQMINSGGGGGGNKHMSLLHDVPTGHTRMHQQQIAGQNVRSNGMLMPVGGGPSIPPSLEQQQQLLSSSVSRRSDLTDARSSRVLPATHSVFNNFPLDVHRNSFTLASAQGISVPYQEELTSSDAKASSLSAATVTTTRFGLNDWDLRNVGMVFDSHQNTAEATSVEAEHVQSHYQQQQQLAPSTSLNHMNQIYMNGGSVRVKSEKVVETETFPIATTLYGQQYKQEDLMSPLLNFDGNSINNIPVRHFKE